MREIGGFQPPAGYSQGGMGELSILPPDSLIETGASRPLAKDLLGVEDYDGTAGAVSPEAIAEADQALRDQGYVFVGYHGAGAEDSKNILQEGLHDPGNRTDQWRGFFVADDAEVAHGYANQFEEGWLRPKLEGSQLIRVYLPEADAEKLQNLAIPLDQEHQAALEFEKMTGIELGAKGEEYLLRGAQTTGEESTETLISWALADKAVTLPSSIRTRQTFGEPEKMALTISDWEKAHSKTVAGRAANEDALRAAEKEAALSGEGLGQASVDSSLATEITPPSSPDLEGAVAVIEEAADNAKQKLAQLDEPDPRNAEDLATIQEVIHIREGVENALNAIESSGRGEDAAAIRERLLGGINEELDRLGVEHGVTVTGEIHEALQGAAEHDAGLAGLLESGALTQGFRMAGRAFVAVGALTDGYKIITADNKALEAAKVAGGWTGALASAVAAEEVAAPAIGAAGPFAGAVAAIVGLVAGAAGYMGGAWAGGAIYDAVEERGQDDSALDSAIAKLARSGENTVDEGTSSRPNPTAFAAE